MLRGIILSATLVSLAMVAPALAQQVTPEPPDDSARVVIEDMSVEEAVRSFVEEVGAAPRGQNLARWGRDVCAGAINIKPDYAQRLVDHVSLVALAIGMNIGEPGCRPNVIIFANSDGDALATRLVEDHYRKFRPPDSDGADLGRAALRRFETTDAPVRWWHVSQLVSTDTGDPIALNSQPPVRSASRLYGGVRQDLSHVIIVLDTTRIGAVSFGSLSDYVAMVSLAQVDAEADTREFPSILNLFASKTGDRAPRMTQWDLDYLIALYTARGDAAQPTRQENQIAREMLDQPSGTTAKD